MHKFVLTTMVVLAQMATASVTATLHCDVPAITLAPQADGSVYPLSADSAWYLGQDAPGAPAVPRRTYLFAVPDGMALGALDCRVTWEELAANVRLAPQPEAVRDGEKAPSTPADPALYGLAQYPESTITALKSESVSGVTIIPVTIAPLKWHPSSGRLERAQTLVVQMTFTAAVDAVSRPWSPAHREMVQKVVVNPAAVSAAPTVNAPAFARKKFLKAASSVSEEGLYRTNPETNAVNYLLVSPPDFFADWCWYVRARKAVHTNLYFAVKNTTAIYAAYPFGKDLACRNAAESIHAYLRQAVSNGLQYVVLGGAWLDAQNLNNYTPYFATGEAMSLSNCVPGIYGFPREDWRQIPADLFYGCLDMNANQKYPWDNNGDGKYIDKADCQYNDTYPDVCVSRLTLNPHSGRSTPHNPHALITNYVAKLARGEDKYFNGHYRYGMSVASTGSSKLRKTGDRMYYRELEFYDDMYNMFDPRHHDSLEDGEYSTRVRYYEQFSNWRPLRSVKGMMNYTWTETQPTLSAAMDDYYASDRDFGYVQAHGWAQGAAQFSAYRFALATGLTLFNGGSGPCETGYPDYHVTSGGRKVLQYNVGDAAVMNPDGGALASVNNSRWSWAGGGGGFAAMSYYMLNEMLIGFNGERLDVGHAWLKGVRNYWPAGRWGNTAGWVLTEQFLYGDPLVRLPEVPNVWWCGSETGVWDQVTANWTNSVDAAKTFDAARNVYFDCHTNLALTVAGEIAAMRLSLPFRAADGYAEFAGTGTLKVVQAVDVAGTNATLKFNVAGGVGHAGIRFVTDAGQLVFEGTNKFYVGGVSNVASIALRGGGVTLDIDEFAPGTFPLHITGPAKGALPLPNELRSKTQGGLTRFGALAMTNTHVKLATVEAFGIASPRVHTLANSELEIAANAYYQRSGFPEGLNATFLVEGDSAVTSSEGGLWTVQHTTTFALGQAHLTLSATTANAGGHIIITNRTPSVAYTNVVEVSHAAALAGYVTIGPGTRLILRELPLTAVTALTVGAGATIELPEDASGYWQIVPVSAKFTCAEDVTFVLSSDPTNRLTGASSQSGAFFQEGALYRWTGHEGDWNTFFANRHPKILFGDIAGVSAVTVRVAAAVAPDFAFFANRVTKYVFEPVRDEAHVLFSSVDFCGPTEFNVPIGATQYVTISAATSRFVHVAAPYVHVAAGAGLALAGSHWTDFRLSAGAFLVAVPDAALNWNADTTFTLPEEEAVRIDVSALSPLTADFYPLIIRADWQMADVTQFQLVQAAAELRLSDTALGVTLGEDMKGPYECAFAGETNWDTAAWHGAGGAFTKAWSQCALDWAQDAVIWATNGAAQLNLDCAVHLQALALQTATNDFTLCATTPQAALNLATLDLTACHGTTTIAADLGSARILTAAATNATDIIHLCGMGSGVIELSGVTLILDHPGDWSLTAGAQGVLQVVAPQAHTRFRVAQVGADFKDSALTVIVTDAAGHTLSGFDTAVADGALWCVPPAVQAVVPPGTNDLTRLAWRDMLGNTVSNVDWSAASTRFLLIGTPTSGVVIAKRGFAEVWDRLSVSNEVVIYGRETLAPAQMPGGAGVLTLAGAFTVQSDVNAQPTLLSGARLCLAAGSALEISHRGINYDARAQDWRGITGTGRVVLTDSASSWLALPSKMFADTLTLETASDSVLTESYVNKALNVRNLSGSGLFRADWAGGGSTRTVRTVQTRVTAYAGYLHHNTDSRTAALAVASDAPAPTLDKALILTGAAVENHALTVETNGCVILTGTWQGPITVAGWLVITNACATNACAITCTPTGRVVQMSAADLPAITSPGAYVAPDYPADEETALTDSETADADEVRTVTAHAPAAANWRDLEWRDKDGQPVAQINWARVTNAVVTAAPGVRVLFDVNSFSGCVQFVDGVLEVHKVCPFVLSENATGTIAFWLASVPTGSCKLVEMSAPGVDTPSNLVLEVCDRYGLKSGRGDVVWDARTQAFYWSVQDIAHPTYSCTFDTQYEDTLSTPLWFNGSGNLTYKARPEFFVESQAGRALLGTSMDHFAMYSHNGVPTVDVSGVEAWSLNFVARLPTNDGGIVFGWGNKDSGNGVALACVAANVAGVYAWEDGGGARLIATAAVPGAREQYHVYTLTHDSRNLVFYVDGLCVSTVPLVGKYPTRGFYQWFKMYGQNGGLANGPTTAVDDFRLYLNVCLTPSSVAAIADDFPAWPTVPTAVVDVPDLTWSNLYWTADCRAAPALAVVAGTGNLLLDAPLTVTNALAFTAGVVPLKITGTGQLNASGGLTITHALEIDAGEVPEPDRAAYAAAQASYRRWLVCGAYRGEIRVVALPRVSEGYSVHVEADEGRGVCLVFTGPHYVADVTGNTAWDDGAGPGLDVKSFAWRNSATSTITLTQQVNVATVTFNTSVTGLLFKVVNTNAQALTIQSAGVDMAVAEYDFTQAEGAVTLSNDVPAGTSVDVGRSVTFGGVMAGTIATVVPGASVRYAKPGLTLNATQLKAGVTNTFAAAVVQGDLFNTARIYSVRAGDDVTLRPSGGGGLNYQFGGHIVVEGGRLLLDSQKAADRFWYGTCGAASFTQTGGEVSANAKSEVTDGNGCFLFGVNGGGAIPVTVLGGTFAVLDSPVCFWQDPNIALTIGGTGIVRVKGLWGNAGARGVVRVKDNGVLSVGAKGIAANLKSLTLAGGLLTAHTDATTAMTITLEGESILAAENGVTHTVSGTFAGNGAITIGATNRAGVVRLTQAEAVNGNITLAYGTLDIGTLRPSHAIARTGGIIQIRLTADDERALAKVALLPISAGTTKAAYSVLTSGGVAIESSWLTIEDGVLMADTSGMDFAKYVMPLRGTMAPGKTWEEQEWRDSASPANRIPAVYWGSASNVVAVIDIASNAEVRVAACVTNVTVTGAGTVISDGQWPHLDGLTNSAWRGTVRITNMKECTGSAGCTFAGLGNAGSTVEMDGVAGWFNGLADLGADYLGMYHDYTLKIGAGGLTMNNGNSKQGYAFRRLTGSGVFTIGKSGPTFRVVALDADSFTGQICVVGSAGVTLGTPAKNPNDGQIVIAAQAQANITAGAQWSTASGFECAPGSTVNVITTNDAQRYTVTRGNLTLSADAALTFNGGPNVRDVWYVIGGDIVHAEEWAKDVDLATNYTAKAIVAHTTAKLILRDSGCVTVEAGFTAKDKLTIDARELDGTNLAACAVAGAPYSRWLVKGPVAGEINVLPPNVPAAYAIVSEILPDYGVRLIVTANGMAQFGAISVNLYRDALLTASDKCSGLYPVARSAWTNLLINPASSVVISNTTFELGSGVTSWKLNNTPPDDIYQQYMDDSDGRTSTLTISGVPYAKYRIIVHYSTDTPNSIFQPLVVNGVYYAAQPAGTTSTKYTLTGVNVTWGNTGPDHQALAPAEGVNALVTDVLTNSTATILAIRPKGTTARATIAAVQVLRVGLVNESIPARRAWANPVTGTDQNFLYHFTGNTDATWDTLSNWEKYGTFDWQASTVVPMVEGSNTWDPTVIDGHDIADPMHRVLALSAKMEGWTPQLALFNGVTVTVSTVKKLQGSPKWFWVDASSQLQIKTFGSDSYDGDLQLFVAGSNGVIFAANPTKDGTAFKYYFKDTGSVAYGVPLTKCTHQICRADIQLSDIGIGRAIRSKRLVALAGSGNVAFTWSDVTLVAEDPLGEIAFGTLQKAISTADDIGACVITQRTDGVYLDYVDRTGNSHYVYEVDYTNGVQRVEIPVRWLMQLTNGPRAVLTSDALTPEKVSAALANTHVANGIAPWASYLLGLEPTNDADHVSAAISFVDGKVHVNAKGLDEKKFRGGVKVRYILETTADLSSPFQVLRAAQSDAAFDALTQSDATRFYRVRVELVW